MSAARGRGLLVTLVVAYVVAACVGLALLLWSGLAPAQREPVTAVVRDQAAVLLLLAGGMVAGLGWLLVHVVGRYAATARRLTADTRLLLGPNPDHHLDTSGPAELAELAGAVNELAERRRAAEGEVARQVSGHERAGERISVTAPPRSADRAPGDGSRRSRRGG